MAGSPNERVADIRVGFSTSPGFFSWIGRLISGSQATHCYISVMFGHLEVIIHSTIGGVQVDARTRWEKENTVVDEFDVLADVSEGFNHAVSLLGARYDYSGYFGFLPIYLGRWLGMKWKNPGGSPTTIVCSELLLSLRRGGKIPEWSGLDLESTPPGDLLDLCYKGDSFSKVKKWNFKENTKV